MRSRSTDFAMTCPLFCISSFKIAYSVRVSETGFSKTETPCDAVSSFKSPRTYTVENGDT